MPEISIDPDVMAVLEFMQKKMPADKLVSVAENLAPIARLIWGHHPQQVIRAVTLFHPKPGLRLSRSTASESDLAQAGADDGFGAATAGS